MGKTFQFRNNKKNKNKKKIDSRRDNPSRRNDNNDYRIDYTEDDFYSRNVGTQRSPFGMGS